MHLSIAYSWLNVTVPDFFTRPSLARGYWLSRLRREDSPGCHVSLKTPIGFVLKAVRLKAKGLDLEA